MNKILSWKIGNGVYAYVYPVNNDNTHVAKKIPENSPLWDTIISEISTWDRNKYTSNFDKMAKEVKEKYAIEIPRDIDKYWGFTSGGSNVNIVLLSGDDGSSNSNNSNDNSENITSEDINEILDKIKDEAYARQSAITQYILTEANKTIADAKNEISDVKEHLDNIKDELGGKLSAATDAINATKKLFDDGDITPEKINDALSTISEHGEWVAASSGFITSIRNGVDEATQQIGGIADAEDPVRGYFSTIASNINALSGTVGTVSQTVDASQGKIEDMASWYDTNASAATHAVNYLNASAGTIGSTLEYVNGSGLTTYLNREMDARAMTIKDTIESDFEDSITSVNRVLDGFSGVIKDTVVKYNETSGKLTSLGDEMDATNRRMAKYMNITDDTQREVMDFRETWTEASGMLRTVGKLIYEEDADGNATGKVFPAKDIGEKYEEYKKYAEQDVILKKGEDKWKLKEDGTTIIPDLIVLPNLSQVLGSFISQTASEVALGVANDEGTLAQIAMGIAEGKNGEGESYINMIASKVQISGDLIANSLSSTKANIGGIIIGSGQVKTENDAVIIDGNNGSLTATKGTIGGIKINESSLSATNFSVTSAGVITANDIIINGGSIVGSNIEDNNMIFCNSSGQMQACIGGVNKKEEEIPILSMGFDTKFVCIVFPASGTGVSNAYAKAYVPKSDIFSIKYNINTFNNYTVDSIYFIKSGGTYYKNDCTVEINTGAGSHYAKFSAKNNIIYNVNLKTNSYSSTTIHLRDLSNINDIKDSGVLKMYNDGAIECDNLNSNGTITGRINSDGIFKGNLKNVDGTLTDVVLKNALSLYKNNENIFSISTNNTTNFNRYIVDTSSINFEKQNKTKNDKTYTNNSGETIFEKNLDKQVDVTINEFDLTLHRFIPFNRTPHSATVTFDIYSGTSSPFSSVTYSLDRGNGKEVQDETYTFKQLKITGTEYIKIVAKYNFPTSNKYGGSYSSAILKVDNINLDISDDMKGGVFDKQHFRYISPNGLYGIEISNSGIKMLSGGTWGYLTSNSISFPNS